MGQTIITKKCTNCGDCLPVCPTNSIFFGFGHYVIDADTCGDCQICIPVCPETAIFSPVELEPEKFDDTAEGEDASDGNEEEEEEEES